jgi:hypothetical protein
VRHRRSHFCSVFAALAFGSLMGCSYPYTVWVIRGSTATQLVFGLATDSSGRTALPIEYVTVSESACDFRSRLPNGRVWSVERAKVIEAPPIERLRFGAPPAGYREEVAATPLHAGCYEISVTASGGHYGRASFRVDPSGIVVQFSRRTLDSAYAVNLGADQRHDSIAATRCAAAYRVAHTARDTARVDQQVWYDTTVFPPTLTCQFICTKVGPNAIGESGKRTRCASTQFDKYGRPL